MSNGKVSILMCVFNSGEFLCPAIESVLNQSYHAIELIVIDDHSTDDSWEIACDYAERDSRIKTIYSSSNRGASAALNKGLRIAEGDYITRHDSDDVMFPERLEKQVEFLNKFPEVNAIGTNIVFIDPGGNEIGVSSFPLTDDAIQEALPDYMCFCGPTLLVTREAFRKAGYYFVEEYTTAQDYDLCLRLSEVTKMGNLEQPLYRYRQHHSSVSVSKRHEQLYYKVRSLEQAAQRRFGKHPPVHYIDFIARDYMRAAVLGCLSDQIASSRRCLELALRYQHDLLNSPSLRPPLGEIVRRYLPEQPLEDSIADVEKLFQDLFPRDAQLERLKARLMAELYIEEVFARAQNSPTRTFELDLVLKGVRHNPVWLRNRGIQSILVKQPLFNLRAAFARRCKESI
jgi:glycosyltransferase involved in cell wall biosynthesis